MLLEGPDLHELLARVPQEYGTNATVVHAEQIRTGGIAGFFARQRFEIAVEVDVDEPVDAHLTEFIPRSDIAACDAVLAVAGEADGPAFGLRQHPDRASATAPAVTAFASVHREVAHASLAVVRSTDEVEYPVAGRNGERTAPRMPREAGEILVLVGDAAPAYEAALQIARSSRLPATRVLVASPDEAVPRLPPSRRVTDVAHARLHATALAVGTAPAIVVVTAPIGLINDPGGRAWVADIIDAVGAADVWAVVDATRNTRVLHRWLRSLGPISALVAHEVAVADLPLRVHDLGFPVAFLDGSPTTSLSFGGGEEHDEMAPTRRFG